MLNTTRIHRLCTLAISACLALPAVAAADTVTFNTPGTTTWTVPKNVTAATFEVVGASGGRDRANGSPCTPGNGGDVTGGTTLVPGETLQLAIGGRGGDAVGRTGGKGGSGGGADGGTVASSSASAAGGGGGGATSVAASASAGVLYLVAGGGGGCGGFASGLGGNGGAAGSGGSAGSGGPDGAAAGGGAAGSATGAAGGANVPADSTGGARGSAQTGGAGSGSDQFLAGGGGGGGGLGGGGGGGAAIASEGSGGGGGGGESEALGNGYSSWHVGTASNPGDGSVTISFSSLPAPTAATGAASGVTDSSASLAGTINAEGLQTNAHFEYGLTDNYGQQTADRYVSATASDVAASATLSGLTPGAVYHYRVVATNATGTAVGADHTFRTTGPPSLSTAEASAVTTNAATLTGTVDPNGHDTMYRWEYGPTTSYGSQTPDAAAGSGVSDQPVKVTLTGLAAGTVFHYRLVATNASGTTNGPDHTLQTAAPPSPSGAGTGSQQQPGGPVAPPPSPRTKMSGAGTARSATLSVLGSPRAGRRGVSVTVACAGADCRVGAVLSARVAKRHILVIGSTRAVLRPGSRRTITIALSAAGRRLQARRVRVPATLVLSLGGIARPVASRQLTVG